LLISKSSLPIESGVLFGTLIDDDKTATGNLQYTDYQEIRLRLPDAQREAVSGVKSGVSGEFMEYYPDISSG
jgi:hypothetical protein